MSEETIVEFVTAAAPVCRQLERNTGRPARATAISISVFYSHRTTQRLLSAAEQLGYFQRTGKGKATRWILAPTFPLPLPVSERTAPLPLPDLFIHQLELPFAFAA
jgi:hypothetical protein